MKEDQFYFFVSLHQKCRKRNTRCYVLIWVVPSTLILVWCWGWKLYFTRHVQTCLPTNIDVYWYWNSAMDMEWMHGHRCRSLIFSIWTTWYHHVHSFVPKKNIQFSHQKSVILSTRHPTISCPPKLTSLVVVYPRFRHQDAASLRFLAEQSSMLSTVSGRSLLRRLKAMIRWGQIAWNFNSSPPEVYSLEV